MNLRVLGVALSGALLLVSQASGATNDVKLGTVRIDAAQRAISFPAEVNQRVGLVEYLLVHESGKVHESILRTKVGAQDFHAAALLFSEASTNKAPKLTVKDIEISWAEGEKKKIWSAAELILDKDHRRALGKTKWTYRGSRLVDGVFLAQRDGSLIAIMEDQDAVIDQGTPEAANDENWEPMTDRLPAIGTAVEVRIFFSRVESR